MAIGTINISVGSILTELGLGSTTQKSIYELFGYSDSANGALPEVVNYHNIAFGPSTGNSVDNIFTPFSNQANLSLNNWRNYNHTTNIKLKWSISNTTRGPFDFEIYVERPGFGPELAASSPIDPGDSWIESDYDSGIASDPGSGYKIRVAYIGGDGSSPNVFNAQDVDGVGPDTFRQLTPLPPFVPPFTPFNEIIVEGDGGQDIAWSKRTSFEMTI